jgi:hypothetical protein
VAPVGTVFTLIENDGNDAVSGTFANSKQGATLNFFSLAVQIAYDGGDGNDVTLTLTKLGATTCSRKARSGRS